MRRARAARRLSRDRGGRLRRVALASFKAKSLSGEPRRLVGRVATFGGAFSSRGLHRQCRHTTVASVLFCIISVVLCVALRLLLRRAANTYPAILVCVCCRVFSETAVFAGDVGGRVGVQGPCMHA